MKPWLVIRFCPDIVRIAQLVYRFYISQPQFDSVGHLSIDARVSKDSQPSFLDVVDS